MFFNLFFGLFAIGIGLAIAFRGLTMFKVLLPFWAFFVGLSMGGAAVSALLGGSMFVSLLGIGVGLVLGLIFAAFSYFAFGFAVMILGASLGWQLGVGFMSLFGLGDGFLAFVVGLLMAVIMAVAFMAWRMPRILVVALTAMVGSITTISGALILFGVVNVPSVSVAATSAAVSNSAIWTAVWLGLTVAGIVAQFQNEKKKEALFNDFIVAEYK